MVLVNQLNIYLYTFDKIHNQCKSHLDYGTYSSLYNISGDLLFVHMYMWNRQSEMQCQKQQKISLLVQTTTH